MIGPISRGDDAGGLVRYLLGPGRAEEHTNQRVIAAEAAMTTPRGVALSAEDIATLAFELDLPHRLFGTRITRPVTASDGTTIRQPAHVWHLSLSNPVGDRILSDAEWAAIAEDLMERMGFSLSPQHAACPWVAVHHGPSTRGNDHIHIAVSLVRDDGSRASVHQERNKVGKACSDYEAKYGLTIVEGRSGGAAQPLSEAEVQAERQRRAERPTEPTARPRRAYLETTVRGAAVASATEAEFIRRLRAEGLMVLPFYAKGGTEVVAGYRVGIRGENAHPMAGYTLAKDLSLPRLRELWGSDEDTQRAALSEWKRQRPRTDAHPETRRYASGEWHRAAAHVGEVVDRLAAVPAADDATWRAIASESAGVIGNLASRLEADKAGPLTRAADKLSAAAHRPSSVPTDRGRAGPELRGVAAVAAQAVLAGGPAAWLALVTEMHRLARAIENAHAASGEAGAARTLAEQAGRELEAVHTRYASVLGTARGRGHALHGPAGQDQLQQLPVTLPPTSTPGFER